MAAELPDALEKLALKAERSESGSSASLSKYFGQADHGDDIFDAIGQPQPVVQEEEPKVNFFKSPASTPAKEELSRTSSFGKTPTKFAFKKGDDDEPKIFSYFSQPEVSRKEEGSAEATEFFDHISELASKTHEPLEISSHTSADQPVISQTPSPRPLFDSLSSAGSQNSAFPSSSASLAPPQAVPKPVDLPLHPGPTAALHPPIFSPRVASTSPPIGKSDPSEAVWSQAQERASRWWIPSEKTRRWLNPTGASNAIPSAELSTPSVSNSVELVFVMQNKPFFSWRC